LVKELRDLNETDEGYSLLHVERWDTKVFHIGTLGIHQGVQELALAAHDMELARYSQKAYDYVMSGKDKNLVVIPEIGFYDFSPGYGGMEGCSVADMTAIAVKLTQLGLGDEYFEDIDRNVRNYLTGMQRTRPDHSADYFRKIAESGESHDGEVGGRFRIVKTAEAPVGYWQLADHLPERLVGSVACYSSPNDYYASTYFDSCCNGNFARAIYYAWESILKYDKKVLTVHLLLNRTSPWADIDSYIPYIGRVDVKIKKPCDSVRIRMNNWVEKDKVTCKIKGEDVSFSWDGNYIVFGKVEPKQTITIEFPIHERVVKLEILGHKYTAIFKGNDCVDISPKGIYVPMFQRDHYRFAQPRFMKVRRFACENVIHQY